MIQDRFDNLNFHSDPNINIQRHYNSLKAYTDKTIT